MTMFSQIRYGFNYNYPICCIMWFITGYHAMRSNGELFCGRGNLNLNEYNTVCERIMCPTCLIEELYNL